MKNLYVPEFVEIDKVVKETKDIITMGFRHPMRALPGQFIEVSLLGIGEAPFGVASYREGYIEFTVRNVGNLTRALQSRKKGDKIGVRGPFGNGFPMTDFVNNDLIIIGGGTGVAPVRSVIIYAEKHRNQFGEVHLFFGFRSPEEFLYKKDLENWKRKFQFNITIDKPHRGWKGNVGFLNQLVEKSRLNNTRKIVIICGPPIMIEVCAASLQKLGFNNDQIFVSLERLMQCGLGKCGHCMINDKYVCRDGPVFRYDKTINLKD
ncbi:FAD/NAD(P)-binding protein [Candidatus Woesearchaeota archaeon]|nr:FAD/NAD(P)-binding protein [Candidatus Woesearchaeota archaeon]